MSRSDALRALRTFGLAIAPGAAFFVLLMLMSMPQGIDTLLTAAKVPVDTGSAELLQKLGASDAGSLLGAAMSITKEGTMLTPTFGVFNYWPPGMVGVDIVLLAVEKVTGLAIVFLMVVLNAIVWSVFLGITFQVIRARRGIAIATIFAAGSLLYSGTALWGVNGGLFYSDSFGALAFCAAIVVLYCLPDVLSPRRRFWNAIGAGLLLGTAAYFRASYELVDNVIFVVAGGIVVILLILRRWRPSLSSAGTLWRVTVPLALAGVGYMAFTLPWRLYATKRIRPGDLRWSTVADLVNGARWKQDALLNSQGAKFLEVGHVNWSCEIDPVKCADIARLELASSAPYTGNGHFTNSQFLTMSIQSIFEHPLAFLGERLAALTLGVTTATGAGIGNLAVVETVILAILLVLSYIAFFRRAGFRNPGFVLFTGGTLVQVVTLAGFHMESRYFLGIELGVIVVSALVVGRQGKWSSPGDLRQEVEPARPIRTTKRTKT